jgi:hypothetical protein
LRIKYNQKPYDCEFDEQQKQSLRKSEQTPTFLKLIEAWLERTPCLVSHEYDHNGKRNEINFFLQKFQKGFQKYVNDTYVKRIEVIFFVYFYH